MSSFEMRMMRSLSGTPMLPVQVKEGKQMEGKIRISESRLTRKGWETEAAAHVQRAICESENRKPGQAQSYCLPPDSRKKGNEKAK